MTGEMSLNQKVLAVGGIKEKVLAAKRAEVAKVFLPEDCRNSWDELDPKIREGIEVKFVKMYDEIKNDLFDSKTFSWMIFLNDRGALGNADPNSDIIPL